MTDNPFDTLQGYKFIALSTYRKSGEAVVTPVWFTRQDGKLYVWTGGSSGKVKRLRNNPRVSLAPSDAGGRPLGEAMSGWVYFPPEGEWKALTRLFQSKYGLQFGFFSGMSRLRGQQNSIFLEISPAPPEPHSQKTD
jgi:PPOX class probable F420-dependent enzyme